MAQVYTAKGEHLNGICTVDFPTNVPEVRARANAYTDE